MAVAIWPVASPPLWANGCFPVSKPCPQTARAGAVAAVQPNSATARCG
jgi:hypothetical protein